MLNAKLQQQDEYMRKHINYERHLRKGVEDRLAAYCYEQQQAEATRQRNATLRAKAETDRVDALVESRDRLQLKLLEVQAEQQKTEEENLQLKATIADLQADYQDIVPRLISKLAVTNTVNLKLNLKEDLAEAQGKLQLQDTTIAALTASNAELSARLASSLTSESTLKAELSCVAADRDDLAAQLAAG